ncbi:MAG: alpha/beta hydrolase [Pseudomonadota bacterium]
MRRNFPNCQFGSTQTLAYLDRPGRGTPILFLHGNGFSKEVFAAQFSSETLADHRLLALDLPGHGRSQDAYDPKATYSYAGFAREVEAFIAEIGLERCIVAGWSLGGQIALEMLDAMPAIAGVIAFGAAPAPNGPLGILQSMHLSKILLLAGKGVFTREDAEYFEKACFGERTTYQFVPTLLRTDPCMRPNLSKSLLYASGISQKQRLERSHTPVCLLHGRGEPLIRTSFMRQVSSAALYGGTTIILEQAGHAPFVQAQSGFERVLKQFADDVETGTALLAPAQASRAA